MAHAEQHAPDNRKPHEIARAILNHPYMPSFVDESVSSFLEDFCEEVSSGSKTEAATAGLVNILSRITRNEQRSVHRQVFENTALSVLQTLKDRNDEHIDAIPFGATSTSDAGLGDEIANYRIANNNLKNIEKQIRALATSLGWQLNEPGRKK